jgi:hypothetical protein
VSRIRHVSLKAGPLQSRTAEGEDGPATGERNEPFYKWNYWKGEYLQKGIPEEGLMWAVLAVGGNAIKAAN